MEKQRVPIVCRSLLTVGTFFRSERMLNTLASCRKCSIRFTGDETERYLCPQCVAAQEEHDIQVISEYLQGHPHDTLINIASGTGVTMRRLLKLIVGGRLDRRNQPRI